MGGAFLPPRGPASPSVVLVLLVLVLLLPAAAEAQWPRNPVGARIRVSAPAVDSALIVGRGAMAGSDTIGLLLGDGGATLYIPSASVAFVEQSAGFERWKWTKRGAVAGAIGVWLIARATTDVGEDGLAAMSLFIGSTFVGTLLGAGAGALLAPETWSRTIPNLSETQNAGHRVLIAPDARVRLTLRAEPTTRLDDRVARFVGDTLTLQSSRAFAIPELASLEVRGGKNRRRGVLYGVGIITAITAAGAIPDHSKGVVTTGEMLGAFAGNAVVGAIAGYYLAPKGWIRVPLPR